MILTSTYRDRTEVPRDLLAAYSSLDHLTTAELSSQAIDGAFERLLRRLVVLMAAHGPQTPERFLAHLARLTSGQPLHSTGAGRAETDAVDLTSAFLEHGAPATPGSVSELQQEIVHFSRIVDIGQLGLEEGVAEHALRRLRGSDRLADPLKVLSELVIVARSRLRQRGLRLAVPWLRPGQSTETDVADDLTTFAPAAAPDCWMGVRCDRRRLRRRFRYELWTLLQYLTPVEAAMALWAHCHEQRLTSAVELVVVQTDAIAGATRVHWDYQPASPPDQPESDGAIARVAATLPTITSMAPGDSLTICGHHLQSTGPGTVQVADVLTGIRVATLDAPATAVVPATAGLVARACDLIAADTGPDLASVEAAHIHLDRDLDIDQDTGAAIGTALIALLSDRQPAPVLAPMMDDDHVLVRLTPAAYRQFLRRAFGPVPMHLICESSPIIRAIVVALFQRLRHSHWANRFQRRGGNLFLPLEDGFHCELFEDVDGTPVTGCLFFEVALLIYRSAPQRFDTYFLDRYHLDAHVHDQAAAILSRQSPTDPEGAEPHGQAGHDLVIAELQDFYRQFSDVTHPFKPDPHITALVDDVLAQADPVFAHLNVLEDYYELQQNRVRHLIRQLDLPLRLTTVHFNATTGRVILAHD
ncbi:hypothetical protein [Spirillospora sp. CA-294931]|uniref:hypothetical protein n=1 Tax=Spirillospora sp. CA-294931 TaxID=3240042 RepID=UPI003D8EF15D